MAFEFPAAFLEPPFHVAKTGREPDVLDKGNQCQLMLCTDRLDQIVGPQQHASRRRVRNDVGYPEYSHSIYSYRRCDRPNGADKAVTPDWAVSNCKSNQLSR